MHVVNYIIIILIGGGSEKRKGGSVWRNYWLTLTGIFNEITNAGLKPLEGDEETDMCKAIEDIRQEERQEGKNEERFSLLVELVNEGSIGLDKALEKLHMSLDEFYKKKAEYENKQD